MKVIFLDIDGVLNSNYWNDSHQPEISDGRYIDETRVKLLENIVKKTGAVLVLHSGWRFCFDDKLNPICKESENLSDLLQKYRLTIYDKTPDLTTDEIRKTKKFSLVKAQEILLWKQQHKNIESYIVLDDLELHNEIIRSMQVMTDPRIGLSEKEVNIAIQKLTDKKII
jgi:hypothetical protein